MVKKASRDLKIQHSLSRKRSQTTRDAEGSAYTLVNHKKNGGTDTSLNSQSFAYQRDTVNKVTKVKPLNKDLQEPNQSLREGRRNQL